MQYAAILLLAAAAVGGWLLTLVGLPGNFLMLGAVALYAWLGPDQGPAQIGWGVVMAAAGLVVVGEVLESAMGMWGAKRAGGSRRAGWFALLGSLLGAFTGAAAGVPVPVIGPLVGAVFGGAVGALAGAAIAERSLGSTHSHSWRVGQAAFWGRLLGVTAKMLVASVLVVLLIASLIW